MPPADTVLAALETAMLANALPFASRWTQLPAVAAVLLEQFGPNVMFAPGNLRGRRSGQQQQGGKDQVLFIRCTCNR